MARVNTQSIFEVERIRVIWVAELNHYDVIFEGVDHEGGVEKVTINAWRDHGSGPAPELIVEWAPPTVVVPELPTMEMDL